MQIFHSTTADFLTAVQNDFPLTQVTYVRVASAAEATATMREYHRAFATHGAAKRLALVTLPAPAVIPYLSIRSNLLLNGEKVPFHALPKSFRQDRDFLDAPATHLTPEQSLYVQLFRAVLGGRFLIVMRDFPASMDVLSVRAFLNLATATLQQSTSALAILTQDETLLAAHPEQQLAAPPTLTA